MIAYFLEKKVRLPESGHDSPHRLLKHRSDRQVEGSDGNTQKLLNLRQRQPLGCHGDGQLANLGPFGARQIIKLTVSL